MDGNESSPSSAPLAPILHQLRAEPSRTGSIIITLYGDVIVPRGGSLWLGTMLETFRAMGIGEGVVRTAVSRLAADGWLERRRIGRNSFYRLAARGHATFAAATHHIYDPPPSAWGGAFRLVLVEAAALREALEAEGYGRVAQGVLIAPDTAPLPDGDALVLEARADPPTLRAVAARIWPLKPLAERYRAFLATFRPVAESLRGASLSGLEALVARVLLIHQYRRVVLRDPLLPAAILPADWPGLEARALCTRLYRRLVPPSEAWLDANARCETGSLPMPDAKFGRRFSD